MHEKAGRQGLRSYAKISTRRPWIILLVLALIGLAIWGAYALVNSTKSGTGAGFGRRGARPPTTVGVAQATTADVPVTLDALGAVTPTATVTVRPQVSGTITQILFKEGQLVRRGQVLAIIDPRPFQMALLQAQGQLARDEAQLAAAKVTLGRYRTLLQQDSIARQDVDTQAATVQQLEAAVLSDRAGVGTAKLNLDYSRVIAPVSGRVGLRAVDVGNVISTGDANGLVVLTEIDPIDVQFTVPQDEAPQIWQRSARATLPVIALDRTRSAPLAQGAFSTLDNQVDPTTGTVRAKARFANGSGALFPNEFVNVRLTLDTLKGAVVVPLTAVRTGPNGDFVWIVKPDQTVTMRTVKRGQTTATQTVILSGLAPCERVVTDGGDRLTEGGRILLPGQAPRGMGARGGRGGRRGGGQNGGGSDPAAQHAGGQSGRAVMPTAPGCPGATPGQAASHGQSGGAPAASQPADAAGPAAGAAAPAGGGFQPSPEMQAARAALRQACAADMQKLCAGQEGREAFMCLRQNEAQASAGCQAALAKMPRRGGGAGG